MSAADVRAQIQHLAVVGESDAGALRRINRPLGLEQSLLADRGKFGLEMFEKTRHSGLCSMTFH